MSVSGIDHRRAMIGPSKPEGKVYFAEGSAHQAISEARQQSLLSELLSALGPLKRVLLVPPDFSRRHSAAGALTSELYRRLSRQAVVEVLPALGTHVPMTEEELRDMFPGIPLSAFRVHDWRRDVTPIGEVPASFVRAVSDGLLDYPIRCEVASRLVRGDWDRIISIGQLLPHEVAGIAGQSKNIFVGTGGKDAIDRTHFLGAVCGMEAAMGRARSPVREVLSYMRREFAQELPITYLLTVRGRDDHGAIVTRGLFAGDDDACFRAGVPLVQACNIQQLREAPAKIVCYLEPSEFKSTWLGNKAIYRTRMAVANGGELLVLAPGVSNFGEDAQIDQLIRRHGYHGTARTLAAVKEDPELGSSLSAAAHLIHGSSEGRFRIRYAAGGLDAKTIEKIGYEWADPLAALRRYDPAQLKDGYNVMADGERIYFVSNPALGLWSLRDRIVS